MPQVQIGLRPVVGDKDLPVLIRACLLYTSMSRPLGALLDLLFPPRCVFCRRLLHRGEEGLSLIHI